MKIALIEPFYSGSHKAWADGLKANIPVSVDLYTLPGRHWKWRMHGGAVSLARQFLETDQTYDLIMASDMVDLPVFRALTREKVENTPVVAYFHENQLTYPWSPDDPDLELSRDNHYAFINYTSALAADQVWFNSQYHMDAFIDALPEFLKGFPDFRETDNIATIRNKSSVLHLGLDLKRFDVGKQFQQNPVPIILWNHRWEYDKNPEEFFTVLFELDKEGFEFQLVLLGERYKKSPAIFDIAQQNLSRRILHSGFTKSFNEYASWLWKSDVLPVTSKQDYFGISVVEAAYCNTIPIVPDRLAYSEYIPNQNVYSNTLELKDMIANWNKLKQPDVSQFDWTRMTDCYMAKFQGIIS